MPIYLGGQKVSIFGAADGTTIKTQAKTVTPNESQQVVSPDEGYAGLKSVTVNAISKTYVGSGITKKAAATYTPGTSNQTIGANQYLSGAQTIKGDSNLVAGNIRSGVSIFGVTGTVVAASSPNLQNKTVTPIASSQTVKPDSGYDGLKQVTVSGDANLVSGNIISGKTIFGVPGSVVIQRYYTGSSVPSSSTGSNGDLYLQIGG
mgnify:FL=1|jgi:hypothetical protein